MVIVIHHLTSQTRHLNDSTSSFSTVYLLQKTKNKKRDDNEDLAYNYKIFKIPTITNIKSTETIKTKSLSEISQINMNNYLEISGTRTYRYVRNVTQEMADENEYLEYCLLKIWDTLRCSCNPSDKEQKRKNKLCYHRNSEAKSQKISGNKQYFYRGTNENNSDNYLLNNRLWRFQPYDK
ncbi:hypothetical protein H8356DRAFT_1348157 [Neocallimastix lanati (nom. inval.)]|nr:hypothetical protein H8356DRAFT_1348157 [Neocallimastix sp. JGI-2020a]